MIYINSCLFCLLQVRNGRDDPKKVNVRISMCANFAPIHFSLESWIGRRTQVDMWTKRPRPSCWRCRRRWVYIMRGSFSPVINASPSIALFQRFVLLGDEKGPTKFSLRMHFEVLPTMTSYFLFLRLLLYFHKIIHLLSPNFCLHIFKQGNLEKRWYRTKCKLCFARIKTDNTCKWEGTANSRRIIVIKCTFFHTRTAWALCARRLNYRGNIQCRWVQLFFRFFILC